MKNDAKLLISALAFVIIIVLLGIAGTQDYQQEIIYTMPQEVYDATKIKLGVDCTTAEIVEEYTTNQAEYDRLAIKKY